MTFLINQLILAFFNYVNSRIDAYRILKHKTIAHAINFIAYAVVVGIVIWLFKMNWPNGILFCFSAFFNRQIVFDTSLNIRRHLSFFYQSTANPPKSWWDRVERRLWPDNDGVKIFIFYLSMWLVTIGIKIIVL